MGYFLVVRESRRIIERFRAQVAFKRSFAGVRANMIHERSTYLEFLRTQMATVRVKVVVKFLVREERVHGYKGFAANFARKRPLPGMNATMLLARLLRVKTFAANIAREITNI